MAKSHARQRYVTQAIELYHQGQLKNTRSQAKSDYEKALESLNASIEISETRQDHAEALYYSGLCHHALSHHKKAVDLFQAAIKLDQNPLYYSNLGNALSDYGDKKGAIDAYQAAIEAQQDYPVSQKSSINLVEIRSYIGKNFLELRDYDAAITEYQTVIELDPNTSSGYRNLGLTYYEQSLLSKSNGDRVEAHRDLQLALRLYEVQLTKTHNQLLSYLHKSEALSEAGLEDEAALAFNKAVDAAKYGTLRGKKFISQDGSAIALNDLEFMAIRCAREFSCLLQGDSYDSEGPLSPERNSQMPLVSTPILSGNNSSAVTSSGLDLSTESLTAAGSEQFPNTPSADLFDKSLTNKQFKLKDIVHKIISTRFIADKEAAAAQIKDLQAQIHEMRSIISQQSTVVATFGDAIKIQESKLDNQDARLGHLESEFYNLAQKFDIDHRAIAKLERRVQADEIELSVVNRVLTPMLSHMASLEEIITLHESASNHNAWKARLGSYHKALHDDIVHQLNNVYIAAIVVGTGIVDIDKKGTAGKVATVINAIGDSIPVIGKVVTFFGTLLSYADKAHQEEMVGRYAKLVGDQAEMQVLSSSIAKFVVDHELDDSKIHKGDIKTRCLETISKINDGARHFASSLFRIADIKAMLKKAADAVSSTFHNKDDDSAELVISQDEKATQKGKDDASIVAHLVITAIYSGDAPIAQGHKAIAGFLTRYIYQECCLHKAIASVPIAVPSLLHVESSSPRFAPHPPKPFHESVDASVHESVPSIGDIPEYFRYC